MWRFVTSQIATSWLDLKEGVSHKSMPKLDFQNVEMTEVKMHTERMGFAVMSDHTWQRQQGPPASLFPGVAEKRKHGLVSDILEKRILIDTKCRVKHRKHETVRKLRFLIDLDWRFSIRFTMWGRLFRLLLTSRGFEYCTNTLVSSIVTSAFEAWYYRN